MGHSKHAQVREWPAKQGALALLVADVGEAVRAALRGEQPGKRSRQVKRRLLRTIRDAVRCADGSILRQKRQSVVALFREDANPAVAALGAALKVRRLARGEQIQVGLIWHDGRGRRPVAAAAAARPCKAALALNRGAGAGELVVSEAVHEQLSAVTHAREAEELAALSKTVIVGDAIGVEPPWPAARGVPLPSRPLAGAEPGPTEEAEFQRLWSVATLLSEDLLFPARAARVPRRVVTDTQRLLQRARAWNVEDNVLGFGVGMRQPGAGRSRGLCLKVYVRAKLPAAALPPASLVPPALTIPEVGEIRTEVEEVGELRAEIRTHRRPAPGGSCVGHCLRDGGTLGCLVRPQGGGQSPRYLLSAAHVLAASNASKPGEQIWQRSRGFGGGPGEVLAPLYRFTPLLPGAGTYADAALAGPVSAADCDPEIDLVKVRPRGARGAILGERVKLVGVGSNQIVWGEVEGFSPALAFFFPGFGKVSVYQIGQSPKYTTSGDSGAIVLGEDDYAVGLHFGGGKAHSFFCRIENVLNALKVELVT